MFERKAKPLGPAAMTDTIFAILPGPVLPQDLDEELLQEEEKTGSCVPELQDLLHKYKHVGEGFGNTDVIEHRIILTSPGVRPIQVPERRMNERIIPLAKKAVDEMLSLGVIEECSSPWCSPVVPVKKKDGTVRIAIDYKSLNAVTTPDCFPMPRIDKILEDVRRCQDLLQAGLGKGILSSESA